MTSQERSGFFALLGSAALFACSTTLIKIVSASYSGFFISFMRFICGTLACAFVILRRGKGFRLANRKDWLMRGLYGAAAMILLYVAISMTSGGRASMLGNTYPIFVAVFGALMFGERLIPSAPVSLLLCTGGSILILNDGSGYSLLGDGAAVLSAVAAGLAVNHLKRCRLTDDPFVIYLAPCLFGLPVSAAFTSWNMPLVFWPFMGTIAIGFLVFAAQVLMTWGYKYVEASRGSTIFYLETVLAVLFGGLIGERLRPIFFAGAALIFSGLALDAFVASRMKPVKETSHGR